MKICFTVITMIAVLTALAWGQSVPASYDIRQMEKEMETMRDLIDSALASRTQDLRFQSVFTIYHRGGESTSVPIIGSAPIIGLNIPVPIRGVNYAHTHNSFYLHGQGVVFMVPAYMNDSQQGLLMMPALPKDAIDSIRENIRKLESSMYEYGATMEKMVAAREQINTLQKIQNDAMAWQHIVDSIDRLAQLDLHQPLLEGLADSIDKATQREFDAIKRLLVDTLANHGESLSVLKPDEYINLVLVSQTPSRDASGRNAGVISARKSWITDYKAGKMTLEEFREKVLQ
jgi:hypothetical protein